MGMKLRARRCGYYVDVGMVGKMGLKTVPTILIQKTSASSRVRKLVFMGHKAVQTSLIQ
jgi:hypothetical protein